MDKEEKNAPSVRRSSILLSQCRMYKKYIAIFCIISICFVLLQSNSTSPLYATDPFFVETTDSAIFEVIGKGWATTGKIPYRDLFDHKGPIIFLINAMGWRIFNNTHGIVCIQIISLFLYCVISFLTLISCKKQPGFSFWIVCFSLLFLNMVYGGGNTVEEYDLPVIALSNFGFIKWTRQDESKHKKQWAFTQGLCLAFFVMNRATDALTLLCGILFILLYLLIHKEYKNILVNIIYGLAGLLLGLVPFIVYFWLNNALYDFIYGTILHNLLYTVAKHEIWWKNESFSTLAGMFIKYLPIIGLILFSLYQVFRKENKMILWLFASTFALIFLLLSRFFNHYVIDFVPYVVVMGGLAYPKKGRLRTVSHSIVAICIAVCVLYNIRITRFPGLFTSTARERKPYDSLVAEIPEGDLKQVVFYNCMASIYLRYNIDPCYRFFTFQDWQGSVSPVLRIEIDKEFDSLEAKWLLVYGAAEEAIEETLKKHYSLYNTSDAYRLFLLNQVDHMD